MHTLASAAQLDLLIYDHQTKFLAVKAYADAELWKPKHNFAQLIPLEILAYGPVRGTWCMRFEAMNKLVKRFATGGNW